MKINEILLRMNEKKGISNKIWWQATAIPVFFLEEKTSI